METLNKILSLGGFLNGSKTLLGVLSFGYFVLPPAYKAVVDAVLPILGMTLLPIGVAHKVVKAKN